MGGEIAVKSSPGAGSMFWFSVPFEITSEIVSAPAAIESLRDRRVLGVDDNGTNRNILKQQLGNIGMNVACVASGVEAIQELTLAARHGRPYDLAILDLHMPVMNGLMLAREIRGTPEICPVPLMMLTSDRDREEAAAARELDVKIFLVKPVKQASLIRAVGEMFGAAAQTRRDTRVDRPRFQGRVLVVEDNPTNQKVIVLRLEKLGLNVELARNGAEAVQAAWKASFDVILMDCQMPVMDGFEATARIRKMEGRRVPIIALTANAMDGERERCLEAGMDDYLSKPVRTEELTKKLQHWLGMAPAPDPGIRESLEPKPIRV
jgi:CheY-like chemotaxis protein